MRQGAQLVDQWPIDRLIVELKKLNFFEKFMDFEQFYASYTKITKSCISSTCTIHNKNILLIFIQLT